MIAAIAIPTSAVPAASAVQTATKADAGKAFAAALAALLGGDATPIATPANAAPANLQNAKTPARKSTPQDNDTNGVAPATAAAAAPVVPVAPAVPVTPALPAVPTPSAALAAAVATNATPAAPAQAAPAKGTKAQPPAATQTPTDATATASTSDATPAAAPSQTVQAQDPVQPQPAQLLAQPVVAADATPAAPPPPPAQPQNVSPLAQQLSAAATAAVGTAPTQATQAAPKSGQKPAAKQDAAPSDAPRSDKADAQTQMLAAKSDSATSAAPTPQHASGNGTGDDAAQLAGGGKPGTTAPPLSASATPVVMTVHGAADAQTPPTPAAAPAVAVPLDALAVHIARKFESGESRFEIRLDPAELGKLDISMTVNDDGRVQAVVRAERPETLDMLQRDARLLEGQLRQTGLTVDSNSLNFSLGGGSGNRQAFADASPFARTLAITPEIEPAKTAATTVSVRDGVDIRI